MILTGAFLLIALVVVPILAYRSRAFGEPEEGGLPPPMAVYLQILLVQGTLGLLALLIIQRTDLPVRAGGWEEMAPATVLGLGLAGGFLLFQRPWDPTDRPSAVARALSPRRPMEWVFWSLALLTAALGEEIVYRGALYAIFERWTGSVPISALASAAAFGLAHAAQRWRGVVLSLAIGLGLQSVVFVGGGLAGAVLAHLAYDVSAEFISRRQT